MPLNNPVNEQLMTISEAKRTGSRRGLIAVTLGILIAQSIMTSMISKDKGFFKAFVWFLDTDYLVNIIIGIIIMFLCGHFYGQLAGKLILIKKWNYILTGILIGFLVILTTTFLSGWTGFFQAGIDYGGTENNPFYDYIYKPMYYVTIFGLIPIIIVGIWFGRQIKKKENNKTI